MRISEIRNPDLFQSLCQHVLVAEHPDTQIVDDSSGDAGVDAYVPSTRTLYAMYCPEKVPVPKEYYQKKIRDDLGKAVNLRDSLGYAIDHWVLMTPAPLTEELQRYLKEKATDNKFTSGANQSETHLVTLLAKHPHLRSLFSQLITPDLAAQLERVHVSLSSQLVAQQPQPPALEIQFADLKKRTPLGLTADLESEVIELPDQSAFPAYRRGGMFGIGDNEDYWWDKALYIRDTALIRELGFAVKNTSPAAAQNVRAEITVSKVDGARVLRTSRYPSKPKASTLGGACYLRF